MGKLLFSKKKKLPLTQRHGFTIPSRVYVFPMRFPFWVLFTFLLDGSCDFGITAHEKRQLFWGQQALFIGHLFLYQHERLYAFTYRIVFLLRAACSCSWASTPGDTPPRGNEHYYVNKQLGFPPVGKFSPESDVAHQKKYPPSGHDIRFTPGGLGWCEFQRAFRKKKMPPPGGNGESVHVLLSIFVFRGTKKNGKLDGRERNTGGHGIGKLSTRKQKDVPDTPWLQHALLVSCSRAQGQ